MITITVKHRSCYGVDLMDVCDPIQSYAISHLTGKRTVSYKDLDALKVLGCKIIDLDQVLKEMFI